MTLADSRSFPLEEVGKWVKGAVGRAQRDFEIKVGLIVTIRRDYDLEVAQQVADIAMAGVESGIVGMDLAGDEVNYPAGPFAEIFQRARGAGLGITVHAGEVRGGASVREAIETLGAQRIGHGVRIADDLAAVDLVRERGVTLEVCPTSNIRTAAVRLLRRHPLRALRQLGIPVTINTDDPGIFNTTLTDEYVVAVRGIGIALSEIKAMILNGVRAAFLPEEEKTDLESWFKEALAMDES